MEYMKNGSLSDVLQNKDISLSWKQRLNMILDVSLAMKYLHSFSIVHRDLKTPNLLVIFVYFRIPFFFKLIFEPKNLGE